MSDAVISTREGWFDLLEWLYRETDQDASRIPCREICPQCLCERDRNEKVYFLPYEFEYLQLRAGTKAQMQQEFWAIDVPSDDFSGSSHTEERHSMPMALKSNLRACPFLAVDNTCIVHGSHPFDCRSFPLMPVFQGEAIQFELETYCPFTAVFHQQQLDAFVELYTRLWRTIAPMLPASWKHLYWHSSTLVPEILDPSARPRHLTLRPRLIQVDEVSVRRNRSRPNKQ